MERADYLKGQAAMLRGVAGTFDIPGIRNRLLALANECQILARLVGESPEKRNPPHSRTPARSSRPRSKRGPKLR